MKITLQRIGSKSTATLGALFMDEIRCGFTCEDVAREVKIPGETRITAGTYKIGINKTGGMNAKYKEKFNFHEGMIEVLGVPNFTNVYIHVGNSDKDTHGCILVGFDASHDTETVARSGQAYSVFYLSVISAIKQNKPVFLNIRDEEKIFG